jgi:hypothetical protein
MKKLTNFFSISKQFFKNVGNGGIVSILGDGGVPCEDVELYLFILTITIACIRYFWWG